MDKKLLFCLAIVGIANYQMTLAVVSGKNRTWQRSVAFIPDCSYCNKSASECECSHVRPQVCIVCRNLKSDCICPGSRVAMKSKLVNRPCVASPNAKCAILVASILDQQGGNRERSVSPSDLDFEVMSLLQSNFPQNS